MKCPHCDDGRDRCDTRRPCPYCRGSCLLCDRCKRRMVASRPWSREVLCGHCRHNAEVAVSMGRVHQAGYVLALLRRYATVTWMPSCPDTYLVAFDTRNPPGEELRESARTLKPELLALLRQEHGDRSIRRQGRRL